MSVFEWHVFEPDLCITAQHTDLAKKPALADLC